MTMYFDKLWNCAFRGKCIIVILTEQSCFWFGTRGAPSPDDQVWGDEVLLSLSSSVKFLLQFLAHLEASTVLMCTVLIIPGNDGCVCFLTLPSAPGKPKVQYVIQKCKRDSPALTVAYSQALSFTEASCRFTPILCHRTEESNLSYGGEMNPVTLTVAWLVTVQ